MFQVDLSKLHKVTINLRGIGLERDEYLRDIKRWFRKNRVIDSITGHERLDYVVHYDNGATCQYYFSCPEKAMIFKLNFHR